MGYQPRKTEARVDDLESELMRVKREALRAPRIRLAILLGVLLVSGAAWALSQYGDATYVLFLGRAPNGLNVPVAVDDAGVLKAETQGSAGLPLKQDDAGRLETSPGSGSTTPQPFYQVQPDGGAYTASGASSSSPSYTSVTSLPNTQVSTGEPEACSPTIAGADGGPATAIVSCPPGMNRLMCDAPGCIKLNVLGHGSTGNQLTSCVQGTAVATVVATAGTRVGDHLPEPWSAWKTTPTAGGGDAGASDAAEFFIAAEGTSTTARMCCSCQPMP
jgi:hypothetical protein